MPVLELRSQLRQSLPGLDPGRHTVVSQDSGILAGQGSARPAGGSGIHVALTALERVRHHVAFVHVRPELLQDILNRRQNTGEQVSLNPDGTPFFVAVVLTRRWRGTFPLPSLRCG